MKKKYLRLPPEAWQMIVDECEDPERKWEMHDRYYNLCEESYSSQEWRERNTLFTCLQICKASREAALPKIMQKVRFRDELDLHQARMFADFMGDSSSMYFKHVKELIFVEREDPFDMDEVYETGFNGFNMKRYLQDCSSLQRLVWDTYLLMMTKELSDCIVRDCKVRDMEYYHDIIYSRPFFNSIPTGWRRLELFHSDRRYGFEGYLTENEFDWVKKDKEKSTDDNMQHVLSLHSDEYTLGISVTKKYREVRKAKVLKQREKYTRPQTRRKDIIGHVGAAYWLFQHIIDNIPIVMTKEDGIRGFQDLIKQIREVNPEVLQNDWFKARQSEVPNLPTSSEPWKCLVRVGLTTADVILLRTAIPLWTFGAEPYYCEKEEGLNYTSKYLSDEEKAEIALRKEMFNRRASAFSQFRKELIKSKKVFKKTGKSSPEQDKKNMEQLEKEIEKICKALLKRLPANIELEEKILQQKQLWEVEDDICNMTRDDHIRQIAFNLIGDVNLRNSLARSFITLNHVCLI